MSWIDIKYFQRYIIRKDKSYWSNSKAPFEFWGFVKIKYRFKKSLNTK